MYFKKILIFTLLILIVSACSPEVVTETVYFDGDRAAAGEPMAMEEDARISFLSSNQSLGSTDDAAADFDMAEEEAAPAPQSEIPNQERLIIRTANLSLIISDTDESIKTITEMVESNGGWVVGSNVYEYSDLKRGSITVRIPSTGFNSAIAAFKDLAIDVTNESISGQDVTDEFVDISLRLENLEATADRVRSFLDDATEVEDALAVNRELSRLEGEIELLKGRREYLSQSAQFSTITIELIPDALNQPIEIAGWQPRGIAKQAIESLVDALQGFGEFAIWFVLFFLPMALLYGIPFYFVWRGVNRWRLNRRQQNEQPEEPAPATEG